MYLLGLAINSAVVALNVFNYANSHGAGSLAMAVFFAPFSLAWAIKFGVSADDKVGGAR